MGQVGGGGEAGEASEASEGRQADCADGPAQSDCESGQGYKAGICTDKIQAICLEA